MLRRLLIWGGEAGSLAPSRMKRALPTHRPTRTATHPSNTLSARADASTRGTNSPGLNSATAPRLARAVWLSAGQRSSLLRFAVLHHSTGKWGAWGPSPPAPASRQDRCGSLGTLLSLKPRARVSQYRASPLLAPPSLPRIASTWFPREGALLQAAGSPLFSPLLVLCFLEVSNMKKKIFPEKGYKPLIRLFSDPVLSRSGGIFIPNLFWLLAQEKAQQ